MVIKKLYLPITIRKKKIKNRIVLAPMGTRSNLLDGTLSDISSVYYEERAKGGAGIIITEQTSIREGYSWVPSLQIYSDKLIPTLSRLADSIHCYNSIILMQLGLHGGRASSKVTGKPCIAPSSIDSCLYKEVPEELKESEIYKLIQDWTDASIRVKRSGFDGVEVHGSHGYLINQFISPHTNKRIDKWGGNLENRLRFAKYIIDNIRASCGENFIIGFKISAYEHLENGITLEDSVEIAKYLNANTSIDYLHVSTTSSSIPQHTFCKYPSTPSMYDPSNVLAGLSARIKRVVDVPVIATGGISDLENAEEILVNKQADMVAIGRAFLADAYWGLKVNPNDNVRPCIKCNECHKNVLLGKNIVCTVNPGLFREYRDLNIVKSNNKKKLLIIGSGPSGLEAAIQAIQKGYKVTIYEKSPYIGGALRLASIPTFKYRVKKLLNYYLMEIKKKAIDINTSFEITESNIIDIIKKEKADHIILATGGTAIVPNIEGIQGDNVYLAIDVLNEFSRLSLGNNILILGAGKVGLETAWYLSEFGKKVSIIEMMERDKLLIEEHPTNRSSLLHNIEKRNISIICGCQVNRIYNNEVEFINFDGEKNIIDYDSLIIAAGFIPNNKLYKFLFNKGYYNKIFLIGDSKEIRGLINAIHEGYFLSRYIV